MGRLEQLADPARLENRQYQTILRLTHTIAFEFDPRTGSHFVSPFITETLAGTYDNRQLSQVMLEDGVLHPDDVEKMSAFRDLILSDSCGSETTTMRLKTIAGEFRWYRWSRRTVPARAVACVAASPHPHRRWCPPLPDSPVHPPH